jgi:hypothetical protein
VPGSYLQLASPAWTQEIAVRAVAVRVVVIKLLSIGREGRRKCHPGSSLATWLHRMCWLADGNRQGRCYDAKPVLDTMVGLHHRMGSIQSPTDMAGFEPTFGC